MCTCPFLSVQFVKLASLPSWRRISSALDVTSRFIRHVHSSASGLLESFTRQVSCETPLNAVGVVLTNMKILFPERTKLYKISFISSSRGYLKVRPRFVGAVGKRTITKLSLSLWCIASRVAARRWDETEAGLLRRESCAGTGGSGGDVQHSRGWNHQSVHTVLREEQVSQSFLIFIRTSCENCSCGMGC